MLRFGGFYTFSCQTSNSDYDTRVWILRGEDCFDYDIIGVSDNTCSPNGGERIAATREALVEAGQQYFMVWDNRWNQRDYNFNLDFTAGLGSAGQFPQSAIPVQENQT
ncbi:MAG: hypothetical protein AB8G22_10080, partial [Saprospiraceae bacterium]